MRWVEVGILTYKAHQPCLQLRDSAGLTQVRAHRLPRYGSRIRA